MVPAAESLSSFGEGKRKEKEEEKKKLRTARG